MLSVFLKKYRYIFLSYAHTMVNIRKGRINMSKKAIVTVLLSGMFLSLIILLLTIAYVVKHQRINAENAADLPPKAQISETAVPTETVISYCLREFEGGLAVFRGDSPEPYKKLDTNLNLMTEEDRQLLKSGITVDSEKELRRVIEDFTS